MPAAALEHPASVLCPPLPPSDRHSLRHHPNSLCEILSGFAKPPSSLPPPSLLPSSLISMLTHAQSEKRLASKSRLFDLHPSHWLRLTAGGEYEGKKRRKEGGDEEGRKGRRRRRQEEYGAGGFPEHRHSLTVREPAQTPANALSHRERRLSADEKLNSQFALSRGRGAPEEEGRRRKEKNEERKRGAFLFECYWNRCGVTPAGLELHRKLRPHYIPAPLLLPSFPSFAFSSTQSSKQAAVMIDAAF